MSEETKPKASRRWGFKLVYVAVAVIVVYWLTLGRMSSNSEKVQQDMQVALAKLPSYTNNAEYLDALLERIHPAAFRNAYDMGSRRRAASFDEKKYLSALLDDMAAVCRKDGKPDLANQLTLLKTTATARAK